MHFIRLCICVVFIASFGMAKASTLPLPSSWEQVKNRLNQIWTQGHGDLYVPFYAWHNRWTYTPDKLPNYNENPWGAGMGKGIWDERGNWQGLYAIVFLDSHKNVQPMGGYSYLLSYHPTEDSGVGVGFTAMMTARTDILNNWPFPGVLPLASIHYKNLMIVGAYVPGRTNIGNVLFLTTKITLT